MQRLKVASMSGHDGVWSEPDAEGEFVRADEAIEMLIVIRDLMAEKSGCEKSCGHQFECVCAAKAARAILDRIG